VGTLNTYRAAIVGCGRIGTGTGDPSLGRSRIKSHAEAYLDLPNADLVGLCDPDAAPLARASSAWGVAAAFDDVATLLATTHPDLLSICAPPSEHVGILRLAIEAGVKGVILEKPVAPDLATAHEALALVQASKTRVAVNYTRRFPPAYRAAIETVRSGGLGRIQHVHGIYTKGIVNNGSHMIDLLRAMLGDPVRAATLPGGCDLDSPDPSVGALLVFDNGIEAWLGAADGAAFNVFDLDILGTEGRISFTDLGHAVQRFSVDETTADHGFRQLSPAAEQQPTHLADAVRYAIQDLIQSVETGQDPLCTIADGHAALEIAIRLRDNR
jgi:predicted dehydrogenase